MYPAKEAIVLEESSSHKTHKVVVTSAEMLAYEQNHTRGAEASMALSTHHTRHTLYKAGAAHDQVFVQKQDTTANFYFSF